MRALRPRYQNGRMRMPLRCVIVDDYEPFLKMARATLEQQGMVVVGVAANGTEALRQARQTQTAAEARMIKAGLLRTAKTPARLGPPQLLA